MDHRTPILNNSRRTFLKTMGVISIGFPLLGNHCITDGAASEIQADLPGSLGSAPRINAWLEVLENGNIRVLTGKMELGQGILTAIMQVAAEELNTDMAKVDIVMADTQRTPNEGYTAGSRSVETSATAVRYAAAAAREKILEMAAAILKQKPESLYLWEGVVHSRSDKKLTLDEILKGRQIEDEVTMPVKLKPREQYRYVGKPEPRRDIERMVRGGEGYVHDLRFPGMLHARVVRPPGYSSRLEGYNRAEVLAAPGVVEVVGKGSFLAVLAEEEYQAVKGQNLLKKGAKWSAPGGLPADGPLSAHIKAMPAQLHSVEKRGAWKEGEKTTHKAAYSKPYIMHAANGPACAVALYDKGKLQVWSHSQGVYPLRDTITAMLGMDVKDVQVKGVPGSGCYGHNPADDVAAEAALMAVETPGRHVRLQWMRDEEHGWEPYGTAMLMELEAALDESGKIVNWKYDLWSDGHSTRPRGDADNLLPARFLGKGFKAPEGGFAGGAWRNADPYYHIPNQHIDAHIFQGPLRISSLRGLGAYANIFAIESFMDELAEKAGANPFEFRVRHLQDSRAVDCVLKLREMVSTIQTAEKEGLGIAFSRYKNSASYCAVAALVAVNADSKNIKIKKMWAAIDSGEAINPDGIKNQTEGGMIQSASWTVMEEVKFDEKHISSLDWGSYPIFRFTDSPETEVAVIDRPTEPPLGAGEAAQGPAAAAIANAVYQACGKRVRDLPLAEHL